MRKKWLVVALAVALVGVAIGLGVTLGGQTPPPARPAPKAIPTIDRGNVPASINDTCAVDDTAALAKWLYSLSGESTVGSTAAVAHTVNFGAGCYQLDGSLFLRDFRNFTFTGGRFEQRTPLVGDSEQPVVDRPAYCGSNREFTTAKGTDFLGNGASGTAVIPFFVEGGCDITVSHMTIVGPNTTGKGGGPTREADTFITFAGTQRALVDDVHMTGPYGDCVDAQALHEAPGPVQGKYPPTDITVENSSCANAGRDDVSIIVGERVYVGRNVFYSAADDIIDIERDSLGGPAYDIDIANNTVTRQRYANFVAADTGARIERLQISGNGLWHGGQLRIVINPGLLSTDIRIDGNHATGASTASGGKPPAIVITNATMVAIDGNNVPLGKGGLARVPKGTVVCGSVCPPIHIIGPAAAALPR